MKVWYASYGSNLLEERFLAYIKGGRVSGSDKPERGCTDNTSPLEDQMLEIAHPLYFSKERSKWGVGGVAFIGTKPVKGERTLGRMYLITQEQFMEVVAQENDRSKVALNLNEIMEQGYGELGFGWYDRIVYLGEKDDYPIFTFTSSNSMEAVQFTSPSKGYLRTIAKGLEELGLSAEEIISYFLDKKGIQGNFTRETLAEWIS